MTLGDAYKALNEFRDTVELPKDITEIEDVIVYLQLYGYKDDIVKYSELKKTIDLLKKVDRTEKSYKKKLAECKANYQQTCNELELVNAEISNINQEIPEHKLEQVPHVQLSTKYLFNWDSTLETKEVVGLDFFDLNNLSVVIDKLTTLKTMIGDVPIKFEISSDENPINSQPRNSISLLSVIKETQQQARMRIIRELRIEKNRLNAVKNGQSISILNQEKVLKELGINP